MRVMILEDDVWIADLLKQIVQSLRPHAVISSLRTVSEALEDWQLNPADMVICDWNLPDGPGTRLLEHIRKNPSPVPMVMITGRSDRESVLEVRRLKINAFISKPFNVPKVLECLDQLLPENGIDPSTLSTQSSGNDSFSDFLLNKPVNELDMPLQPGTLSKLKKLGENTPDLRSLHRLGYNEPAITARLLNAANSAQYSQGGNVCLSLAQALQTLGAPTCLNLVLGMALHPAAELEDGELNLQFQAQYQHIQLIYQRLAELAKQCRLDPAPLHSAALLHRLGELCVLQQAQLWRNQDHPLSLEQLNHALTHESSTLAERMKAHWRLPAPLRELIGACYELPTINIKRESIVIHLACCEQHPQTDEKHLARLRRLAGLS